jgi:hypothetical protein
MRALPPHGTILPVAPNLPYSTPYPYGPDGPAPVASVRLFSPEAIAAHTLILTPLVGSVLAAINHRRLGNGKAVRHTLLAFALPSAVLLVAQVLDSGGPLAGLLRFGGFAWTIAVARQLYLEHQVLFSKHTASGGATARWYLGTLAAAGVVIVALAAVFASELLAGP